MCEGGTYVFEGVKVCEGVHRCVRGYAILPPTQFTRPALNYDGIIDDTSDINYAYVVSSFLFCFFY